TVANYPATTLTRQEQEQSAITYPYPYSDLPPLLSHITPPFVVINAGPKCDRDQIGRLVLERYPQPTDESREFQQRLMLLCDTWNLFQGARSAAEAWRQRDKAERVGKRKREQADSGPIPTRTTRSKTRNLKRTLSPRTNGLGGSLTRQALLHLSKRPKTKLDDHEGIWSTDAITLWAKNSSRASSLLDADARE
ncbi:hypothetical protein BDR07DRAFT_1428099, partial [Suillus spraguei]